MPITGRTPGEEQLPPPVAYLAARLQVDDRSGLPSAWKVQRPHRRKSKQQSSERVALQALSSAQQPAVAHRLAPRTPDASRAPRLGVFDEDGQVALAGGGAGALSGGGAAGGAAASAGSSGDVFDGGGGGGAPAPAVITLPLDALREWLSAGNVADFAEDVRKHLAPAAAGGPLPAPAEADALSGLRAGLSVLAVLRADLTARHGLDDACRNVVAGLRFHIDLAALAYAAGVPQSKLLAELLAWHDKHGHAFDSAARTAAQLPPSPVRAAATVSGLAQRQRSGRLSPSRVAREARSSGARLGPLDFLGIGGGEQQRPMQRTQQGSRSDSLVATSGGETSASSTAVRQRLAEIAAAAHAMRRTLRVKIEDEQDLALAWKVGAHGSCASRLACFKLRFAASVEACWPRAGAQPDPCSQSPRAPFTVHSPIAHASRARRRCSSARHSSAD